MKFLTPPKDYRSGLVGFNLSTYSGYFLVSATFSQLDPRGTWPLV